ncbi:MAG TPA: hypothetical protein VFG54_10355 [Prolixibacteraceae bacterium]|nr:hypothetical protein [Prolixibacteraceae bacterium]
MKKAFEPEALISLFISTDTDTNGNLSMGCWLPLYPISNALFKLPQVIRILLQKARIKIKVKKKKYFIVIFWE